MLRYATTIFLSAFLLFQVQPFICKYILPWFGGTPAVWATCMVFFQVVLLAGYAYAHLIVSRFSPKSQALIHLALLLISLPFLPILPGDGWKPVADKAPAMQILLLLAANIGVPYLVLSATGPLLQSWFSRSEPETSPYPLYALSNAGSLLALLSYPFVVEPILTLKAQSSVWSCLFALFVLCCGWCAYKLYRLNPSGEAETVDNSTFPGDNKTPSLAHHISWIVFPAMASLLLVATTNHLSQDVAVVPFLWIVPLSLYLLSFIICFARESLYWRPFWYVALWAGLLLAAYAYGEGVSLRLHWQIVIYSLSLFACCMFCHGEVAAIKPGPHYLSRYYLLISTGGALGGIFVTMVAPYLFNGFWEYPGGLIACAFLCVYVIFAWKTIWIRKDVLVATLVLLFGLTLLLGRVLFSRVQLETGDLAAMSRNFYGVLRVEHLNVGEPEREGYAILHGRIRHGFQYTSAKLRILPVSYYGFESGIGVAQLALQQMVREAGDRPMKTGVVGLGAGTIASYGRKGDTIKFYEINPNVLRLSDKYFTYRKDSYASIEVALGDARITMERERAAGQSQQFDILAVDAFSGDAIPLHLLTHEAFALFWYHLRPDGILAVHTTNRYLNLEGLVNGLAADFGKKAVLVDYGGKSEENINSCDWILVTSNEEFLKHSMVTPHLCKRDLEAPFVFTDDYSNLFKLLKKD
jgi:hypothetical protein